MKTIPMTPVDSSQLDSIGHDPATATLAIRFKGKDGPGALYHYAGFGSDDFSQLVSAPSLGSHFSRSIKGRPEQFPCSKVDERHPDDIAVDGFANAMKAKLASARAAGKGGWDQPELCDVAYLAKLLIEQSQKRDADPVDIGNLAMFLFHRPGGVEALRAMIAQAQGFHTEP